MSKTETKSTVLVKHHLKTLKLPTMHAECEKLAARAAGENLDHLAYLLALCELELVDRERRAGQNQVQHCNGNHKLFEHRKMFHIKGPPECLAGDISIFAVHGEI